MPPYSFPAATCRAERDVLIEPALAWIAEHRTGMIILVVVMLVTIWARRR
jgi:hypothetical protein